MPRRTNRGQEIVGLLRRLLASNDGVVEESGFLLDVVTNDEREVDVIWRGRAHGLDVLIGFEVKAQKRPATVEWVEQQIAKHAHLPTDRVVLVSWSGFSASAKRTALSVPAVVLVDLHEQTSDPRHLGMLETAFSPRGMTLEVVRPDGTQQRVRVRPDHHLFWENGQFKAPAIALARAILRNDEIMKRALSDAVRNENPTDLRSFVVGGRLPPGDSWLRWEATGELHAVVGIEIRGEVEIASHEFDLEYRNFIDDIFSFGSAETSQGQLVVVSTHGTDERVTGVIGRLEGSTNPMDFKLYEADR